MLSVCFSPTDILRNLYSQVGHGVGLNPDGSVDDITKTEGDEDAGTVVASEDKDGTKTTSTVKVNYTVIQFDASIAMLIIELWW